MHAGKANGWPRAAADTMARTLYALLTLLTLAGPAAAQDAQRIAAVVNEDIVSTYDLTERVGMVLLTSGLKDSDETRQRLLPQVLRTLIDERLEMQEAAKAGIEITDEDIDAGVAYLEEQNRIPAGTLLDTLRQRGVDPDTLKAQLRAQIMWTRLIQNRVRQQVQITESEIDAEIARLEASRGKLELRLSEIFLSVDRPGDEPQVAQAAERLAEEIARGARFQAVARQFSQGPSAANGGDLGWMLLDQVPEEYRNAVAEAPEGSVLGPVQVTGGYAIIGVAGRRNAMEGDPGEIEVALKRVFYALPSVVTDEQEAEAFAKAEEAAARIGGCDDIEAAGQATGASEAGDVGTFKLRELQPEVRSVIVKLEPGQPSPPVLVAGGVNILVVCSRTDPSGTQPSREDIRKRLFDQRLDLVARGYLRDLRRSAFIDIRL